MEGEASVSMRKPTLFLLAAIGLVVVGTPGSGFAHRGDSDSYSGEFKNAGGTISFSVFLEDGKPDHIGDIDPNNVEIECSMTGNSDTSPTLTGETAPIKHREFKYRLKGVDSKIVFKGELRRGLKAKGKFFYDFTESGDHCKTDGAIPWKAEVL